MGVNSSPSLSQIQSEFGGSNPIGLNEYYNSRFSLTSYAPSSGTISLNDFKNKSLFSCGSQGQSGGMWTNKNNTQLMGNPGINPVFRFYYPGMFYSMWAQVHTERTFRCLSGGYSDA